MPCSAAKKEKKMCSLELFYKKTLCHISDVVTRGGFTEKGRVNKCLTGMGHKAQLWGWL